MDCGEVTCTRRAVTTASEGTRAAACAASRSPGGRPERWWGIGCRSTLRAGPKAKIAAAQPKAARVMSCATSARTRRGTDSAARRRERDLISEVPPMQAATGLDQRFPTGDAAKPVIEQASRR